MTVDRYWPVKGVRDVAILAAAIKSDGGMGFFPIHQLIGGLTDWSWSYSGWVCRENDACHAVIISTATVATRLDMLDKPGKSCKRIPDASGNSNSYKLRFGKVSAMTAVALPNFKRSPGQGYEVAQHHQ